MPQEKIEHLQYRNDCDHRENSHCLLHQGGDCSNYGTRGVELHKTGWIALDEYRMRITIKLCHLFSMYCDKLTIEVHSKRMKTIYQYSGQSIEEESRGDSIGLIALQSSDNVRACRILFPLYLWFWVASMSARFTYFTRLDMLQHTCCPRVISLGKQPAENDSRPRLQILPVGKLWVNTLGFRKM
jgi:hypothetical protein